MESANPFDSYRTARARSFTRLQELRVRMDAWLTANEADEPLELGALALLEGLNAERDAVIQDLQRAEAKLMDALLARKAT